jgi:hypothetical protein
MRWGSAWLATLMIAGSARAAVPCPQGDDLRTRAECVTEQKSPDVIDKLYRMALTAVIGDLDPDNVPSDFIYIAEEAGEAARLNGAQPLVEMASSRDVSKVVFAAHALAAYVPAVRYGDSHRYRFKGEGDAKLYAKAKVLVRPPCTQLAAHDNRFIRDEGERCLRGIDPEKLVPPPEPPPPGDFTGVELASGKGGLRASTGVTLRTSKRKTKAASKKRRTEAR